jgi:hypothetical protein
MGRAVDSARSGAARANADNTGRSAGVDAAATGTPAPTSAPARSGRAPASPARPTGQPLGGAVPHSDNAVVQSGFVALSFVGVALAGEPAGGREAAARSARRPTAPARRPAAPARVTSPDRVTSALAARKTVVLLFYGRGSDDQAMRREMAKVERRGSRVMVLSAPVDTVSRFSVITAGVRVLQSPSVVVVGPTRKARVLPGFTDSTEIDQAVESALRS